MNGDTSLFQMPHLQPFRNKVAKSIRLQKFGKADILKHHRIKVHPPGTIKQDLTRSSSKMVGSEAQSLHYFSFIPGEYRRRLEMYKSKGSKKQIPRKKRLMTNSKNLAWLEKINCETLRGFHICFHFASEQSEF